MLGFWVVVRPCQRISRPQCVLTVCLSGLCVCVHQAQKVHVVSAACSIEHSVCLSADGIVFTFGSNNSGQSVATSQISKSALRISLLGDTASFIRFFLAGAQRVRPLVRFSVCVRCVVYRATKGRVRLEAKSRPGVQNSMPTHSRTLSCLNTAVHIHAHPHSCMVHV